MKNTKREPQIKKYFIAILMTLSIVLSAITPIFAANTVLAKPTPSNVLVNGKKISFNAYNINDFNYFKLRDLALALNGSEKQFNVGWDEGKNTIVLTSNMPYAKREGETIDSAIGKTNKNALLSSQTILKDGKYIKLEAYNIDDYNYFKLRDIGQAFDFGVDWDEAGNNVVIDTSKGYTIPQLPVKLYLPNDNADGFITVIEKTDGTAQNIISLLVDKKAIPAGCGLNYLILDGKGSGTADMNAAYGNALSQTGTTGEYMFLGSVVNTLLDYYGLKSIRLTIDGAVPQTGHSYLDKPLVFFKNFNIG